MDQTVTAHFESADHAEKAVQIAASRVSHIKNVQIRPKHPPFSHTASDSFYFPAFQIQEPVKNMPSVFQSGYVFLPFSIQGDKRQKRKGSVLLHILAEEKNCGKIASTLHSCGGWNVRCSSHKPPGINQKTASYL